MKTRTMLMAGSLSCGVLVASLMLIIGFDHNPQGEFFDPGSGSINWGYTLLLFSVWFAIGTAVAGMLAAMGWGLKSGLRKHLLGNRPDP